MATTIELSIGSLLAIILGVLVTLAVVIAAGIYMSHSDSADSPHHHDHLHHSHGSNAWNPGVTPIIPAGKSRFRQLDWMLQQKDEIDLMAGFSSPPPVDVSNELPSDKQSETVEIPSEPSWNVTSFNETHLRVLQHFPVVSNDESNGKTGHKLEKVQNRLEILEAIKTLVSEAGKEDVGGSGEAANGKLANALGMLVNRKDDVKADDYEDEYENGDDNEPFKETMTIGPLDPEPETNGTNEAGRVFQFVNGKRQPESSGRLEILGSGQSAPILTISPEDFAKVDGFASFGNVISELESLVDSSTRKSIEAAFVVDADSSTETSSSEPYSQQYEIDGEQERISISGPAQSYDREMRRMMRQNEASASSKPTRPIGRSRANVVPKTVEASKATGDSSSEWDQVPRDAAQFVYDSETQQWYVYVGEDSSERIPIMQPPVDFLDSLNVANEDKADR